MPRTETQVLDVDTTRHDLAVLLRDVKQYARHLRVQAWHCADDHDLPGGDALVMIGPAADLSVWADQVDTAELLYFAGQAEWLEIYDTDTDPQPPQLVLHDWAKRIRTEQGSTTSLQPNLERTIAYLVAQVDWLTAVHSDGTPRYPDVRLLVRDLTTLRSRLEDVLHDGTRAQRGAPCLACGRPLVKVYDDDPHARDDRWRCHTCKTWSNADQYALAVKQAARAHATRLNATDMLEQYRIKPGTLTGWAAKGLVRKRGRDDSGRILYDVADALKQRGPEAA